MYKFNKRITLQLIGDLFKNDVKELEKIKKENKKLRKEIEKRLKKTIDYWEYYWDGCGYKAYLKDGSMPKIHLISYDYETEKFNFKTCNGEKIYEALHKKVKGDLKDGKFENNKLLMLLIDTKNFFWR